MLHIGLIYCATNKVNGKKYIGMTKRDLSERIREHMVDKNRRYTDFHKDLCDDEFEWSVLEKVEGINLRDREKYYIDKYETYKENKGYNLDIGDVSIEEYKGMNQVTSKDIEDIKTMSKEGIYQRKISRLLGIKRNVVQKYAYKREENDKYKNTYKDALRVKELILKGTMNLNNISYTLNLSKDFVNSVYSGKYYNIVDDKERSKFLRTPKIDNNEFTNKKSVSKERAIDIVEYIIVNYRYYTVKELSRKLCIGESLTYNIILGYSWGDIWDYLKIKKGIDRGVWLREIRELKRGG